MRITAESAGRAPDNSEVMLYTLENDNGMRVSILNYGGVIRNLEVPDQSGKTADVVLGHAFLDGYFSNTEYFGAAVGRNGNRIAQARTVIGGKTFELEANDGPHNLHSGSGGLSFRLMTPEIHMFSNFPVLLLSTVIPSLADGFPGAVNLTIAYALTDDNALMIDYRASSDHDTVMNFTNHSYFNLGGHDQGDICSHILQMDAPFYTPVDTELIPTGEILSVKGTAFDFTSPKAVGQDIRSGHPDLAATGGYDHNFVLAGSDYRKVATLTEPESGRAMDVYTDLNGVQVYTANGLDASKICKSGVCYPSHQGICFETQMFPNAVNIPWFPSPVVPAGREYTSTTTFQFYTV